LLNAKLGGEILAETGIRFDSNTLLRPDLSYWDAPHLTSIDRDRSPVEVAPQLVAEIVSPSNSLARLFRNAECMIRAGVQVVWIVDRDPFEIHVFEKGQAKRVLASGRLTGSSYNPAGIFGEGVALRSTPQWLGLSRQHKRTRQPSAKKSV